MYYKKPYKGHFELVAVTRIYVLEKNHAGDLEVRLELADGGTLNHIYKAAEYNELLLHPPSVIV